MQWYLNLRIRTKLLLSFALMSVIAGGIGWIGLSEVRALTRDSAGMYAHNTEGLNHLGTTIDYAQRTRIYMRDVVLARSSEEKATKLDRVKQYRKSRDEELAILQGTISDPEIEKACTECRDQWRENDDLQDQIIALATQGKTNRATDLMYGRATDVYKNMQASLDKLASLEENAAKGPRPSILEWPPARTA